MDKKIYNGLLCKRDYGEDFDNIFLHNMNEPLSKELEYLHKRNLTVRYWITDVKTDIDSATTEFLKRLDGVAEIEYYSHYSDYTGYLWTDEELKIGGHDLLEELESYIDKWLILEIEY